MEVPLASASKCELRSVIRFLSAKKVTPIEIHRQLVEVYGEKCMDIKNVRKWSREFNSGRTNVHDEERSGRPSVSDAIVQAVKAEMLKNRRATIRDLEKKLGGVCSSETIRHILVNNLQYHKVSARWVPKQLTEDHMKRRVECATKVVARFEEEGDDFLEGFVTGDETWAHHYTPETKESSKQWRHSDSPKPKKFKATLSAGKVMATVFWDRHGVLLVDFMPRGTTINAARYCETLEKLRRAIKNKRPGLLSKGVKFHHDNARPHTANVTLDLLKKFGWEIIDHPPYSPDVAPSDYHMFPALKKHLGGKKFDSDAEVQKEVNTWLREADGEWYSAGIDKFIVRMRKVLEKNGDYVEK